MKRNKPLRRSPLKRISDKTRHRNQEHAAERDQFARQWPRCWSCRGFMHRDVQGPMRATVDECFGGSQRDKSFRRRCFWAALCQACNGDKPSVLSRDLLVHWLWLKLKFDPDHFDLEAVNEIWQRNGNQAPITLYEIREWADGVERVGCN